MNRFFFALLLAALSRTLEIDIRPGSAETFSATLVGPAAGARGGTFSGRVSLNGSPVELPISARAEAAGNRLRLPVTLRYSDVPGDWANRFRPETFDYRLEGHIAGGAPVAWSGTGRWEDVGVVGDRDAVSRFVRLQEIEVTDISLLESSARALVAVRNPFSFPLTVASSRYRLETSGRIVGRGQTRGMLLRARQESTLLLPIEVEHEDLLAAAGRAVLTGGDVPARLSGVLTVRMPRGDVPVPVDLVGQLSLR